MSDLFQEIQRDLSYGLIENCIQLSISKDSQPNGLLRMIQNIVENAVKIDDSTLLNFTLNKCWNKTNIFTMVNSNGNNLLHEGCQRNFQKSIEVLIEHGIDVNVKNNYGNTGLHYAAKNSNLSIMFLLFEAGVNPFIENKEGKQAFELATNKEIKEHIRQYSIKCSEIKLIKNLTAWKRVVQDEEERYKLIEKQRQFEKNHRFSFQNVKTIQEKTHLNRADSGIVSDADSEKSVDQLIARIPLYTEMFLHHQNKRKDVSKTSPPRSYSTVIKRVHSGLEQDKDGEIRMTKGHGLKVSSLYANIRKTPIIRRKKKIDRTLRMSLPDLPSFGSPESYI